MRGLMMIGGIGSESDRPPDVTRHHGLRTFAKAAPGDLAALSAGTRSPEGERSLVGLGSRSQSGQPGG